MSASEVGKWWSDKMQDSELGHMAESEGGTLACLKHSEKAHLAVGKAGFISAIIWWGDKGQSRHFNVYWVNKRMSSEQSETLTSAPGYKKKKSHLDSVAIVTLAVMIRR